MNAPGFVNTGPIDNIRPYKFSPDSIQLFSSDFYFTHHLRRHANFMRPEKCWDFIWFETHYIGSHHIRGQWICSGQLSNPSSIIALQKRLKDLDLPWPLNHQLRPGLTYSLVPCRGFRKQFPVIQLWQA